jgi:NAD(P)-dependent dehydrogenase (short-subunit alcohol dehydrogenase family)
MSTLVRSGGRRQKRKQELHGQTIVVIGGSAGIGLDTPRRARAAGADVTLAGRVPERLERSRPSRRPWRSRWRRLGFA